MNISDCVRMLVVVVMMLGAVQGRLRDIRLEVSNIIDRHNSHRRDRQLRASDMLEMRWDEDLARKAGHYAEKCNYRRPSSTEFNVGSNLYYEKDYTYGMNSLHHAVSSAFVSWTINKGTYTLSYNCGNACPYIQMITAHVNQVGCALNTCPRLNTGLAVFPASLFICFYSPRSNLLASFPYTLGPTCSNCPRGTFCYSDLCKSPGVGTVPLHLQPSILGGLYPPTTYLDSQYQDSLSKEETQYLTNCHNRLRDVTNRNHVKWDPYLVRWADYIVCCTVDYPGPRHSYTNFARLNQGDQACRAVDDWSMEGDFDHTRFEHGCRTPYDSEKCNHLTNIRQSMVTSMACAAKNCNDGTRQLVCVYDKEEDREYRKSAYDYRGYRKSAYEDQDYRNSANEDWKNRNSANEDWENRKSAYASHNHKRRLHNT